MQLANTTSADSYVLQPDDANKLISKWKGAYPTTFGGVMLWDSAGNDWAEKNLCGNDYAYYIRQILAGYYSTYTCTITSTSSHTPTSTSSTVYTSPTGIETNGMCGPDYGGGACPAGYCCSKYG